MTTIVSDPKYLNQDFVTSTHFKKEADGSKWAPKPVQVLGQRSKVILVAAGPV